MVLCGIVEMLLLLQTLVAIAAGDGVADEFDLSGRQERCFDELTALVEHKTPELREELVALDDIHQTHQMTALGQCCCQRHH